MLPGSLLPVPSLASAVVAAGVELVISDRVVVEATDEEVVGGRTVVKLEVGSTSTHVRS